MMIGPSMADEKLPILGRVDTRQASAAPVARFWLSNDTFKAEPPPPRRTAAAFRPKTRPKPSLWACLTSYGGHENLQLIWGAARIRRCAGDAG